jgi:hypothetical protein
MNSNLSYMLSRVSAVSTQTFKLESQNSNTAAAGQQIRVALPSNCLLSLRSISLLASATCGGSGARLPAKITSLIDRVSLEAGGVTIDGASMQQYGLLCHAKASLEGDKSGPGSHPAMVRAKNYHNNSTALTGTQVEAVSAADESFTFDFEHTFLGTCAPSVIDTSLLPDMVLVIQLHGNEVLSSVSGVSMAQFIVDGTQVPTYSLSHIRFTCEAIALGSGVYDQLVARKLADSGVLELPFKQYSTIIDTHSGSSRFHISCQSLDRIWACFRQSGYDDKGAPVVVNGHVEAGGFISATTGGSPTVQVGISGYDSGSVLGSGEEKYLGKYHDMYFGASNVTAQFQLNGSLTPGFGANAPEWLEISRNAVEKNGGEIPVKTLDQYKSNYSVICHRLTLPGSTVREIAGVDTRGINLSGSLNTTNVPANTNVVLFLEHTSVLQIGQNKQFSVIN